MDKIDLLVVPEQKRQIEDPHHRKDLSQAYAGKCGAVELTNPDLFEYVHLITCYLTRVNPETNLSLAFILERLVEASHMLHPGGPLRGNSCEFYPEFLGGMSNTRLGKELYPEGMKHKKDDQTGLFCQNILLEEKVVGRFSELAGHGLNDGIDETNIF